MKAEVLNRFDTIMANLKPVEPSVGFDFEFRKRFEQAIAKKYEETGLEKLARRTAESIRYALLPKVPVLVRTVATVMALLVVGLYIYSAQPACPVLVSTGESCRVGDVISAQEGAEPDIILSGKYAIRLKERTKIRIAKLTPRYGKGKASFNLIEGDMLVNGGVKENTKPCGKLIIPRPNMIEMGSGLTK